MNNIHPTAIIEDGVTLGKNNVIEAYSIIRTGVTLGNGNVIRSYSDVGVSLHYNNIGYTYIGNDNYIYTGSIIQAGLNSKTIIGNNNVIYGNTVVSHDCRIGNNNTLIGTQLASNVIIDNNCTIYGNVSISNNVHVGNSAIIAAGANIFQHVLPFTTVKSERNTKTLYFNNQIGRTDNLNIYNIIFKSNLTKEEVLIKLKELPATPELIEIISFYESNYGAICK